jgi:hypothetical protein
MSVLKITNPGGIMPAFAARDLPDAAAQVAENILARAPDFRPLADDTNVATSGVSAPLTLYRLARKADGTFNSDVSTGWITNAQVVNYVKGALDDDASERTAYTFGNGSAPPRVMDVNGADRLLGVPAPTAKATVTLVEVDELTTEEASQAAADIPQQVATLIREYATISWLGPMDGTTDTGYIYVQDTNHDTIPSQSMLARVYRLSSSGGANTQPISNTYCSAAASAFNWVFQPAAGASYSQANGSPSWEGAAGTDHVWVQFRALAKAYTIDWTGLTTALEAIPMPGATDGTKLFTTAQITGTDGIVTRLQNWFSATDPYLKPLLDSQSLALQNLRKILDTADTTGASDATLATSFQNLAAQMDKATQAVEDHFAWVGVANDSFLQSVGIFLGETGVAANLPPGVVRVIQSRFYLYTYVDDWGQESAPSPVSVMIEPDQNDEADVAITAPPSSRNIVGWRLYRSNTGSQSAAFQLVADPAASNAVNDGEVFDYFAIGTLTYHDAKKSSELQETCPSMSWLEPPAALSGLVGMPNGILAGFFDNTVALCEPFYMYAWPVEYQLTTEYPITALGVFGQTLVIMHRGGVDYAGGADSASFSAQKNVSLQACVSARSVVSVEGAVIFASPDGLCMANGAGVQVITGNHFTREDWQALGPSTIIGAYSEESYYFLAGSSGSQVCYALHLATGKLTTVTGLTTGSAFFTDKITDSIYLASDTTIKRLFAGSSRRTGRWRSKKAVMVKQEPMAWAAVESDFEYPVTVKWYGDGVLRYTATFSTRDPQRLPSGRYLEHEVEIDSQARWNAVTLASSSDELKGI